MSEHLDERVRHLEWRLARVEQQLWPQPTITLPAPPRVAVDDSSRQWGAGVHATDGAPAATRGGGADLEELLGRHGLAIAGGGALLVGLAFFVVLAASRGWLSEPVRVGMATVASSAFLVTGAWLFEARGRTQAALAPFSAPVEG